MDQSVLSKGLKNHSYNLQQMKKYFFTSGDNTIYKLLQAIKINVQEER